MESRTEPCRRRDCEDCADTLQSWRVVVKLRGYSTVPDLEKRFRDLMSTHPTLSLHFDEVRAMSASPDMYDALRAEGHEALADVLSGEPVYLDSAGNRLEQLAPAPLREPPPIWRRPSFWRDLGLWLALCAALVTAGVWFALAA